MKKQKIAGLILMTLSIVALSACQKNENVLSRDTKVTEVTKEDVLTTDQLVKLQESLNEAVLLGDLSKCLELKMPQFVESCQSNILANQAVAAGNSDLCNGVNSPSVIQRCTFLFQQAIATKEPQANVLEKSPEVEALNATPEVERPAE